MIDQKLKPINQKLKPSEAIKGIDGAYMADFWSWAFSDIVCNTTRSIFAEFLVGSALGVVQSPRKEWDYVDFVYRKKGIEKKIEVKSSAYIQSWPQKQPSVIGFDIGAKLPWYADTNEFGEKVERSADCYVFCLYPDQDLAKLNDAETVNREIIDACRWRFLVLPTDEIENDEHMREQGTIRLSTLEKKCKEYADKCRFEDHFVGFHELKQRIDSVLFGEMLY